MLEAGAGFLEQHLDVRHGLLGLAGRIADGDALAVSRSCPIWPRNEDHGAARDHRLAEIVVELLLRVGVLGIELADALVDGHEAGTPGRRWTLGCDSTRG